MRLLQVTAGKSQEEEPKHRRLWTKGTMFVFLMIGSVVWSLEMTVVKQSQFYKDFVSFTRKTTEQNQNVSSSEQGQNEIVVKESAAEHQPHIRPNHSYPFTFAACLIARDDNLLLPEWIAYHYTVMPLRHLIIAADPLSITSPAPILDAFREELPDLTIELWTGNSYWYDGRWSREKFANFDPHNHTGYHAYIMHLQRQSAFYTTCLRKLKQQGNFTWTMVIDTDEFFTYNAFLPSEQHNLKHDETRKSLPTLIGHQNETIAHWMANDNNRIHKNSTVCYVYPRLFFSAVDKPSMQERSDINSTVPKGFAVENFHTLRYRSHWPTAKPINGKSLVHVGNYNGHTRVTNPHRPFDGICDNHWSQRIQSDKMPFRVNHYTGSLETFVSRPSRTKEQWHEKNSFVIEGQDPSLAQWFHSFVDMVGLDVAYKLTVKTRQVAASQWKSIKQRMQQKNETIPLAFEYDKPQGSKRR